MALEGEVYFGSLVWVEVTTGLLGTPGLGYLILEECLSVCMWGGGESL